MNKIVWLEFELAYFKGAVQHLSHYTPGTSLPNIVSHHTKDIFFSFFSERRVLTIYKACSWTHQESEIISVHILLYMYKKSAKGNLQTLLRVKVLSWDNKIKVPFFFAKRWRTITKWVNLSSHTNATISGGKKKKTKQKKQLYFHLEFIQFHKIR